MADYIVPLIIGFLIGVVFVFFILVSTKPNLEEISIECGKLGYDKAFVSQDTYYCGNELERINKDGK